MGPIKTRTLDSSTGTFAEQMLVPDYVLQGFVLQGLGEDNVCAGASAFRDLFYSNVGFLLPSDQWVCVLPW